MANHSGPICPIPAGWPQLTDDQWETLAPLLPQATGSRAETTRRQVNAMIYMLEGGAPWRLLPPVFGPLDTVEKRARRWAGEQVFQEAYAALYPEDDLSRGKTLIIGGQYIKAHRAAAGARKGRSRQPCQSRCPAACPSVRPWDCPDRQAIAWTRGGFNTLVVLAVNQIGQLVRWRLLPGCAHPSQATSILIDGLYPARVVARAGYDRNSQQNLLAAQGIEVAVIKRGQRNVRYPEAPDHERATLEAACSDLLRFHRVATRYEKTAAGYDAIIALAALWRELQRDYPCRQNRL